MSTYTQNWEFNVTSEQVSPALQRMGGKVDQFDQKVGQHKNKFGQAMKSNRDHAMSFGEGMEQVASRIHPMLGNLVGQVRNLGGGLGSLKTHHSFPKIGGDMGLLSKTSGSAAGGLGNVTGMLTKMPPQAMAAAAGIGMLIAGLTASTLKAAEFSHEFRQLGNLNLSKTDEQVNRLKMSVLDSAFEKGIDPMKMSKGFFDFQSITGKFGKEVEDTGAKVADFSKSYIVDFNKQLEGTGQAMKAFGFGGDQVDRFLASSVKTVQVGKTTFEQLAQVRAEYFDSAAGSGFDFEDADKLFAVYSVGAKSVDIAATQVKESFRALSDGKVIKELSKVGVEVFDPVTNKIKTMDAITKDLVGTFGADQMSDKAFAKIKSAIGGGDGMSMLLNKARAQGQDFLQVFKDFDSTPVNFKKALAGANKDLFTMWETTKSRLSVSMIQIGQNILPHVIKALEFGNTVIQAFAGHTEGVGMKAKFIVTAFKGLGTLVWAEFQQVKIAVQIALAPIFLMIKAAEGIYKLAKAGHKWATGGYEKEARDDKRRIIGGRVAAGRDHLADRISGMSDSKAFKSGNAENVLNKILADSKGTAEGTEYRKVLAGGGADGRKLILQDIAENMKRVSSKMAASIVEPETHGKGYINDIPEKHRGRKSHSTKLGDLTRSEGGHVLAEGKSVRNISVSIQQLVGEINIRTQTIRESAGDMSREVEAAMVRAVRNAEIAIGN